MRKNIFCLSVISLIVGTFVCRAQEKTMMMPNMSVTSHAIAVITPTKGSSVYGIVTFESTKKGVHIIASLSGLKPGKHGFHIHEFGDISSDDGMSAGGHFNPAHMPHSNPSSEQRHAGDMGNITADDSGNAHLDYYDSVMSLDGPHSIIGHAVIVHEKEDDFTTQPTGNAGARIGNGVIGIAK
ncbi:MAG TPA: superoxide dismutase family protein [Bacteroidota bacterium]|nr:superoxide dismutase family protein [Bacteroidota bacterium]